jgi:hypothetical protein
MNEIKIDISLEVYKALVMQMEYPNQPFDEILKKVLKINSTASSQGLISSSPFYIIKKSKRGIEARGRYADDRKKKFKVLQGSKISPIEDKSIQPRYKDIRNQLYKTGLIDNNWLLKQDYVFNSISEAASVISGGSRNGNLVWNEAQG